MNSPQPLNVRVRAILEELEEQCAQAEVALRSRNWLALKKSFWEQRRIRQALINELAAEKISVRTMPDVFTRLQAIHTFRNDQLRRMTAYRTEVSRRLQLTRKWKDATRSARKGMGPAPVLFSRSQ
jgi:hypothetical protein